MRREVLVELVRERDTARFERDAARALVSELVRERDAALIELDELVDVEIDLAEVERERDSAIATVAELVTALEVLERFAGKVGRDDLCEIARAALAKAKEATP